MTVVGTFYRDNIHNAIVDSLPVTGANFGTHALHIDKKDSYSTAITKAAAPWIAVAGVAVATGFLGKIVFARAAATYAAQAAAVVAGWAVSLPVIGVAAMSAFRINAQDGFGLKNIARVALPVIAGVATFFFAPAKLVALIPVKPLLARIGLGAVAAVVVSAVANKLFNNFDAAVKKAEANKKAAADAALASATNSAGSSASSSSTTSAVVNSQSVGAMSSSASSSTATRSSVEMGSVPPKADKSDMSPEQLAKAKADAEAAAKQKDHDTVKANGRVNNAKLALADAQKKFDAALAAFNTAEKTGGGTNVASDIKDARDATAAKLAAAKKEFADAEAAVKNLAA